MTAGSSGRRAPDAAARDRGSGTVLVLGLLGVVAVLVGVVSTVGTVIVARHRAESAADLAALAAAEVASTGIGAAPLSGASATSAGEVDRLGGVGAGGVGAGGVGAGGVGAGGVGIGGVGIGRPGGASSYGASLAPTVTGCARAAAVASAGGALLTSCSWLPDGSVVVEVGVQVWGVIGAGSALPGGVPIARARARAGLRPPNSG